MKTIFYAVDNVTNDVGEIICKSDMLALTVWSVLCESPHHDFQTIDAKTFSSQFRKRSYGGSQTRSLTINGKRIGYFTEWFCPKPIELNPWPSKPSNRMEIAPYLVIIILSVALILHIIANHRLRKELRRSQEAWKELLIRTWVRLISIRELLKTMSESLSNT